MSLPRQGSGNDVSGSSSDRRGDRSGRGFSSQNFSRAAPGPRAYHGSERSFETLSYAFPIEISGVVARTLKPVEERASSRRVCPPEMRRVKKGNAGSSDSGSERKGVRACACCRIRQKYEEYCKGDNQTIW